MYLAAYDALSGFVVREFVPVTNITGVPGTALTGTELELTGTVVPADATNQNIVWSVLSPGNTGAAIDGNRLTAASTGTVTVRATIANGLAAGTPYTQDFNITVTDLFIGVTNITGVPSVATAGVELILTGTVEPHDATNQDIVWSVLAPGNTGAAIDGNRLTAASGGTVTVRATIANGLAVGTPYTQDFYIAVNEDFVAVTNITGVPETATAGIELILTGTVEPHYATNQDIAWSVLSPGNTGAAIDGNRLTATSTGTVTVRATIADGTAAGMPYTQDFTINIPVVRVSGTAIGYYALYYGIDPDEFNSFVTVTFYIGQAGLVNVLIYARTETPDFAGYVGPTGNWFGPMATWREWVLDEVGRGTFPASIPRHLDIGPNFENLNELWPGGLDGAYVDAFSGGTITINQLRVAAMNALAELDD